MPGEQLGLSVGEEVCVCHIRVTILLQGRPCALEGNLLKAV